MRRYKSALVLGTKSTISDPGKQLSSVLGQLFEDEPEANVKPRCSGLCVVHDPSDFAPLLSNSLLTVHLICENRCSRNRLECLPNTLLLNTRRMWNVLQHSSSSTVPKTVLNGPGRGRTSFEVVFIVTVSFLQLLGNLAHYRVDRSHLLKNMTLPTRPKRSV